MVVVDDEENVLSAIKRCLRKIDAKIIYFSSPYKALLFIQTQRPDIVISDQRMPGLLGTELLSKVKELYPHVKNILLSAYNDFEDVANAFNHKTIQKYLSKPWDNKELFYLVEKTLSARKDCVSFSEGEDFPNFHGMVSKDVSMERTYEFIKKASASNIPIFITGGTGTGKELAAKACHAESCRNNENFIAVNCANFSDSLMESQLFGHTKGAFTGAIGNQQGLLAAAGKGTLFLDEVTCLPLPLQAKLLRVLQEREFCPIGSNKLQQFEAQVITASSIALRDAVKKGEFREDLFYRLDVISIELPRLSMRGKDILLLAEYFLSKFCGSTGKVFQGFSKDAENRLLTYSWPGNIRQLENLIHSMVILNDGIEITDEMIVNGLPLEKEIVIEAEEQIVKTAGNLSEVQPLWIYEKEIIQKTIDIFNGNIPKASVALEVSPSTIYRKIQNWKSQAKNFS